MRNVTERFGDSDEVDVFDLIHGIWRQKFWVMAVSIPVLALGLAYAKFATPVYEAKLYVQPPPQNDISPLNYGRGSGTGLSVWTVKEVYEIYVRSLQSQGVRSKFFRTVYLPTLSEAERKQSRDGLYREFNTLLTVGLVAKDVPTRYVITSHVSDPQQAAEWVTKYAELAAGAAKREVLQSSKSDMLVRADNLEQEIIGAKSSARKERDDKIAQLKEALTVARSIGLERPPIISGNLSTEVSAGMDGALTYMRGSKALESEIKNLVSRSSDDPFIRGLREKEELARFFRNLRLDPAVIAVYQPDGAVDVPDKPVKPRKAIIVILSGMVGLVLGVAVALGREMWFRRSRRPT